MSVFGAFPTTEFKYSGEYDQTATDRAKLDELEAAQGSRAQLMYEQRVGGKESLAQEQQRMALASAQRQMAGAAAAGNNNPLAQRQAMTAGTRMATDIAGQAGGARQQEIMGARAMVGDVYAQQSARALALQDMENKRKQAALMAELERMRGDMIEEQGKVAMYGRIMSGAMQAVGGATAGLASTGGQPAGQTGQTGQAIGQQSYGSMGSSGQTYWTPQSYNINDYYDTAGMKEIGPNAR